MYEYKEREVRINNILISKSGFRDLRFESSRYSDGKETIRGFGSQLNERNLTVIDTISLDFILKDEELENLANIYAMFKAIGILPIENEYLLKKIRKSITKGVEEKDISSSSLLKKDISHLLVFLERLQVTSLEKTSDGYDVNMILTLYQNAFSKAEYNEYISKYNSWKEKTNFDNICSSSISSFTKKLSNPSTSNFILDIYNVEKLNAFYKNNILDAEAINQKLYEDSDIKNEEKESNRLNILKNKVTKMAPVTIEIENKHITQIELITSNIISNLPLLGNPIGLKSLLGIGKSNFSIKMLFDENEQSIVEELKVLSDKNIINHKFHIKHPLVQLFDFYASDIINMTFNNLENVSGIMVTIVFNITGFRYEEEQLLNSSDIIAKRKVDPENVQEKIAGLYLEHLSNYLYKNRKNDKLSYQALDSLLCERLEGKETDMAGDNNLQTDMRLVDSSYYFLDVLASYSSHVTSFGYHTINSGNITCHPNFPAKCKYNQYVNKSKNIVSSKSNKKYKKDVLYVLNSDSFIDSEYDKNLNKFREMQNASNIYIFLDMISLYILFGNEDSNQNVYKTLYNKTNTVQSSALMDSLINPLGSELFKTGRGLENKLFEVFAKFYEEFYFRLYDIYYSDSTILSIISQIKNEDFIEMDGINFTKIYNILNNLTSALLDKFLATLNDDEFIDRIITESYELYFNNNNYSNAQITLKREEISSELKTFILELKHNIINDKDTITTRTYNIFLTKLSYFFVMYKKNMQKTSRSDFKSNIYEEKYLKINEQIKPFLISSCSSSILLTNTSQRTDHFGEFITIGMQNIGIKISEYNKSLTSFDKEEFEHNDLYNLYNENNPNSSKSDEDIYKLFPTLFGSRMKNSYYLTILTNKSVSNNKMNYISYDDDNQKDCLYFYGQSIPRLELHTDIVELASSKDNKKARDSMYEFISEIKQDFLTGKKFSSEVFKKDKDDITTYGIKDILTGIQYFGLSYIPSKFRNLWCVNDDKEPDEIKLNDAMKTRIISNRDIFTDLESITKTISQSSSQILPDYIISIFKSYYNKETIGDIYQVKEKQYELFARNVSKISVSKDPKTKIKTALIEIVNTNKHIFNINEDGSFNIKELEDGEVEIIRVEPGDEIRIRLGYDEKSNIFNGTINNIMIGNNIMQIQCVSFASSLFGHTVNSLKLSSKNGGKIGIDDFTVNVVKGITSIFNASSYKESTISNIDMNDSSKNYFDYNKFLFNIFDKDKNSFLEDRTGQGFASMFTAFSLCSRMLPRRILEKFDGKLSNITQSKLLNARQVISNLSNVFGAASQKDDQTVTTLSGYTFRNLNNVDRDYETYGIYHESTEYELLNNFDTPNEETLEEAGDEKPEFITNEENTLFTSFPCNVFRITELFSAPRINKIHLGIDISPIDKSKKDAIFAVGAGKVLRASTQNKGAGNYVTIEHSINGKKIKTKYFHLDSYTVKDSDVVMPGDIIGYMGNTGSSTAKHLHFEIEDLETNQRINPLDIGVLPKVNLTFKSGLKGSFGMYSSKK